MTIKELYEFAIENHCENYDIKMYDDYSPIRLNSVADLTIDNNHKDVIVWVDEVEHQHCSLCGKLIDDVENCICEDCFKKFNDVWK